MKRKLPYVAVVVLLTIAFQAQTPSDWTIVAGAMLIVLLDRRLTL
jgi:hypothetical protein